MKINKIKIRTQIRKDMGDLTELKKSIQENGILQPILIDTNNNLIAGHRRLHAAKELELNEVPVQMLDVQEKNKVSIIQLVENIHRKNLDPIEESNAYNEYMTKNKTTIEQMSQMIGKTKEYIQRRVNLKNLIPAAIKALKEKKIVLGHALLLNQMKISMQKESIKFILEYDLTVQNFSDQIRWMGTVDFMSIEFRQEETDGTKQKTLLEEIGKELNPKNEFDTDLKKNDKFKSELGKYVESQRKILRKKGIIVFNNKEELIAKHPEGYELKSWESAIYNKAVKSLQKSNRYAVIIDLTSWGTLEKSVYSLFAKKEKKVETKTQNKTEITEKDKAEISKMLELNREEKLKEKINIYKHDFLVKRAPGILKLNTKSQRIVTIGQLAAQMGWDSDTNIYGQEAKKILGIREFDDVKNICKCTINNMDEAIKALNKSYLASYENKELEMLMIEEGFKYDKETVITKEFLELHTKDQLIELATELKLDKDFIEASKHAKKGELIEEFLSYELEGMVPKIMGKSK